MPKKKPTAHSTSQLRIIGGQWRGRKLSVADVEGLRPTGDRIRETLFNWLQQDIRGVHCLDCFAGTGALGLEALSRGAQSTVFIEHHPLAAAKVREHCKLLGIESPQYEVIQNDVITWLAAPHVKPASIDIAFLDPPFSQNLWQPAIAALEKSQLLSNKAWIYIEAPKRHSVQLPPNWEIYREKIAGDICYSLVLRHTLNA